MIQPAMYEVWQSRSGPLRPGPRFRLLTDAMRYICEHTHESTFAVRLPDGAWLGEGNHPTFFRRRAVTEVVRHLGERSG